MTLEPDFLEALRERGRLEAEKYFKKGQDRSHERFRTIQPLFRLTDNPRPHANIWELLRKLYDLDPLLRDFLPLLGWASAKSTPNRTR